MKDKTVNDGVVIIHRYIQINSNITILKVPTV